MLNNQLPLVSFSIITRNAQRYLLPVFDDIINQDYPKDRLELILVDGHSQDNSIFLMSDFKSKHPEIAIKILNSHKFILASGWNIALSNSTGDIILRVDAHSRIPVDFIRKNVEAIAKGENIVGGQRITIRPKEPCQQVIYLTEISRFGASTAAYRNRNNAGYVDTLAHAAYSRSVFEVVGGYDERLGRTEDNEMHYRMKKSGFKFYYNPEIKSFHASRGNLYALLKQKYSNGLGIGLTMGVQPRCFSLRHFLPLFFVVALLGSILLGLVNAFWQPFVILVGIYLIPDLFFSFESMRKAKPNAKIICLGLPAVFFLMHFAYGFGTVIGLIKMPYCAWKNRNYKIPFPIKPKT